MWFRAAFIESQSHKERRKYHGRQRRKKRQRQKSKAESQPTGKKRKKEIAEAFSSTAVVGFAYAKPTIPKEHQLLPGGHQENPEATNNAPEWAITHSEKFPPCYIRFPPWNMSPSRGFVGFYLTGSASGTTVGAATTGRPLR